MENKKEISADEFVGMAKIESLAKQNAQQAIRIADLEAQLSLYQQQQQQAQNEASEQSGEQAPAEFEPVEVEAH